MHPRRQNVVSRTYTHKTKHFIQFVTPGSTGKDTGHLLSLQFFGDRSADGLSCVIPKEYFVGTGRKTDLDTILDGCKHMRYMSNNEVPEHNVFDMASIKPLVEGRGTGIVSRTIYEKPEKWHPMGGLAITSNHILKLTESQAQDSGVTRRLNVLRLRHVFPEGSERDVKDEIESGAYNAELFWLARVLYKYLTRVPAGSTRIHPRPPRVVKETAMVFDTDRLTPLRDFLENKTEPASTYSKAFWLFIKFQTH